MVLSNIKTIIVLGMHRSATSLIAKGLYECGVMMGDDLLGKSPHNPWGHYENRDVVHLNDRILHEAGGKWDNPPSETNILMQSIKFSEHIHRLVNELKAAANPQYPLIGIKDPRMTLTAKLWLPYLINPHFIFCLRDKLDVAKSLQRRDNKSIDDGIALAREYNRRAMLLMAEFV